MKRALLILVAVALVAIAGWVAINKVRNDGQPKKVENRTTRVERRTIEATVDAIGYVQPVVATEVRSEISGRIDKIHAINGDRVKRDQVLVELDKTSLLNELTEAQRQHQAQVLRLQKADRDLARLTELRARDFVPEREHLDAVTEKQIAQIEMEVRKARLENAEDRLSKAVIRAPQDGIVSDQNINVGQVIIGATSVNQGTLLMKINDLDRLLVEADVNEIDINKVKIGDPSRVTFDSMPGIVLPGAIREIAPSAQSRNNLRVFPVKVSLATDGIPVRPGISANVSIPTAKVENAVAVILSGVFAQGGERFVFVQKPDGTFEKRVVKTGINDANYVQILTGLAGEETLSLVRPAGTPGAQQDERRQRPQGGSGGGSGGGRPRGNP